LWLNSAAVGSCGGVFGGSGAAACAYAPGARITASKNIAETSLQCQRERLIDNLRIRHRSNPRCEV